MTYRPVRDRGVYRAAANRHNPNHRWALRLVRGLKKGISGLLRWVYRDRGHGNWMRDLVYAANPFMALLPKEPEGAYVPAPYQYDR